MRYVSLSVFLITALTLVGCGDSRSAPPASTPVALADFCNELVDAVCDNVARCDCGVTADADCRSSFARTCGGAEGFLGPEVQARITAGTVVYNASAAGGVIAAIRAESSCDNPLTSVGWGIADLLSFGGTLTGTRTPGTACTAGGSDSPFGGECLNGLCLAPSDGPTRCIGLSGLGATCGIDNVCVDLEATFTSLENPAILLRCNILPGATSGTCATRLAVGATCAGGADCASSRCDSGTCIATLANGEPCEGSSDCSSGFCRYGDSTAVCAATGAVSNGGACTDNDECLSGECNDSVCIPGICGTYDEPSPPPTPVP